MFINFQPISNVVGALLVFVAITMAACGLGSLVLSDGMGVVFLKSALCTGIVGALSLLYKFKSNASVNKREGYLIVVSSWIALGLLGTLPYVFSSTIPSFTDALFETVSGFTTTGATILQDIESVEPSILLWRSLTQWIGGMGIIVLTVALFPLLGIGGIELFVAEAPGPTSDKIHPRIKDTARTLWFIYFGLTVLLFFLLRIEGMTWFDSLNHALTTMATGGFSTKNASIAYYTSPAIQYTLAFFMLLAGTNYTLIYFGLRGKLSKIFANEEWRMYMVITIGFVAITTMILNYRSTLTGEESVRAALFQVASLVTTTGYVSEDYTQWGHSFLLLSFILLFTGACAGSTSGGIKLIRHLVFMRNSILEFKRILHPRAMIRMKINKQLVAPRILTHILVFLLVYLFLFVAGSSVLSGLGLDFLTSTGATATALGNVGPGLGTVGPVDNFAHLPSAAKYILSFLMICGRLEVFTVLILFSPYFWRDN